MQEIQFMNIQSKHSENKPVRNSSSHKRKNRHKRSPFRIFMLSIGIILTGTIAISFLSGLSYKGSIIIGNRLMYRSEEGSADATYEALLDSLEHNPEIADFVKKYPKIKDQAPGTFTANELSNKESIVLQWDERFGIAPYGDSIVALSGCGPTCLSIISLYLNPDNALTPPEIADFSAKNSYYVSGVGTDWSLMTAGASHLGLQGTQISLSESVINTYLDRGNPIVCSVGPGDFTTTGHFIVLLKTSDGKYVVRDPNSIERSKKLWTYEDLSSQIRNLWAFSL